MYLSNNLSKVSEITGLSECELVELVGRFKPQHKLAGLPKGLLVVNWNGEVKIVHHFTRKLIWTDNKRAKAQKTE